MLKTANIEELENGKINKLIWQYAIPAIVGTTVNALYNTIDSVFIGHGLGDDAMNALGIALPIMTIIAAVGMLVGIGSASRISIYLGMGNKEACEKIIGNAIVLTFIFSGITIFILFSFLTPILEMVGATGRTLIYAKEFLYYYLPGSIFSTLCFGFNNMMRASGYPKKAMYTMLISVVANIILAPIFIFIFRWGMMGAALATVISMFISLCFVIYHFINRNSMLRIRSINIRLDKKIVTSIVSIGLSPFFIQLAAATVAFLVIHSLQEYGGDLAVGAYNISNKLVMIIIMVIVGLTQGMQPIVGYNYGAKRYERVKETVSYTTKIGIAIGFIGLIIGVFFPDLVVKPFNPSAELAKDSVDALRIITIMLPLVGFQVVITNFFQSIGFTTKAIFLSLTRQFLFLIPALMVLPQFYGLNGVWASMPTADLVSTILTGFMFLWQLRAFKKLEEAEKMKNI